MPCCQCNMPLQQTKNEATIVVQDCNNPEASVNPEPSMFDGKVSIKIMNLPPNQLFTLHSSTNTGKDSFECLAMYHSNNTGTIDLTMHESVGGFFKGVQSMGLFWAMKSYPLNKISKRMLQRDATTPLVVKIVVYKGKFDTLDDIHMHKLDEGLLKFQSTRMFMGPGVKRFPVKTDGLIGTLFLPPGNGPFPGVINMFGGMPGTLEFKPALFASHGFAALALPYFGIDGLPETWFNIEMEYFEKAIAYLRNHKYVKSEPGVGVVGICKGGQIALAMADCLQGVSCVVAINCAVLAAHNSHTYGTKLWEATECLFDMIKTTPHGLQTRDSFPLYRFGEPRFTSKMFHFHERPNVSFLYIAGLDDKDVPSEYYANMAEKLFKSANHPNYTILRYPGAGHLIEPPYMQHCPGSDFRTFQAALNWGGTMLPHCCAQEDSWFRQIEFLHKHLNTETAKL